PRGREFKHTDVDVEVNDGDLIYGLQVIHTPGHTPGSICLYYPAEKALFIGDLIVNENNILTEIPTQYSLDPEKNREAIKHVYEVVDFELLLPSHGEPILKNGKEKLLTLIKSFEK
ncbi:MAG: MBL fold metallo-hydrolase, partial [archaeon GB-1867-035]|nr:MBL fold metallo-hydrolase [Candidatus Culexmicrobium profundum]